jgi:pyruvate,water dikinase
MRWIQKLDQLRMSDVPTVGGKNASLGEMIQTLSRLGVRVPGGFAVTAEAYRYFVRLNQLEDPIRRALSSIEPGNVTALTGRARWIRNQILRASIPDDLRQEIVNAYHDMDASSRSEGAEVAVRSSATAEDLPTASFAGQQESFLYVHGEAELLAAVKKCFASLFTARAVSYRQDMGFDDFKVALSVGVQTMIRSDLGSSGVIFTLDTDSGFRDVVMVNAIYGLGENIVQGKVKPDEFYVHKPTLDQGHDSLVWKKLGSKEFKLVMDRSHHRLSNVPVAPEERQAFCISDAEVLDLARWAMAIERHYSELHGKPTPMDIEWAKDGETGELFVLQARPETVHSQARPTVLRMVELLDRRQPLVEGLAVGDGLGCGRANLILSPTQIRQFGEGEVLVTDNTDPDWEPIMKLASAIVTTRGGRTSHAAIVARELGIPAVVGTENALDALRNGMTVTVSCCEGDVGRVYEGEMPHRVEEVALDEIPTTRTRIMMNLANPEQAFKYAQLPNDGVGLARMEFIFASWVGVHPLALTRFASLSPADRARVRERIGSDTDPVEYFVDRLSQGIGTIAAAFYPRPVILRFSDFKTNEYANLVGGRGFEPEEENPMIGWRGASRYYHPEFKEGFLLELEAVKHVRNTFGLRNLAVMVPFCRTPGEGRQVLAVMREAGLERGVDGLEVYVMAEIPSNVLVADEFAVDFDGFSIGSNDLTQLCLGVDRDSERIASLFDERSTTVKRACKMLLQAAHAAGVKVGICGQAPSDYPDFARFLVEHGIDSMSLTPDAIVKTRLAVAEVEAARQADSKSN